MEDDSKETRPRAEEVPQFALNAEEKARRRALLTGASPVVQLLIGDAIGDAFGAVIEMQDAYWIREAVSFDKWPENPMKSDWTAKLARGMYTDDCEMTVGLMNGLTLAGCDLGEEGMLRYWQEEYELAKRRPRPAHPGVERSGHGSIKWYFRGNCPIERVRNEQAAKVDPGNAPPMRALPLAFVDDEQVRERLCEQNANATHPHPRARAASFLIATAARLLIKDRIDHKSVIGSCLSRLKASRLHDQATEDHLAKLEALPDYHDYGERFRDMSKAVLELLCGPQPCPPADGLSAGEDGKSKMNGLWSDSMRTAGVVLYLLKHHTGPLDILRASVDVGGDVDSVAALCLGVLGGWTGLKLGEEGGLPWFLVEELEGVEYLVTRAKAFEAWVESGQLKPTAPR